MILPYGFRAETRVLVTASLYASLSSLDSRGTRESAAGEPRS
ncbi:hypothetical protein ACP3TJ_09115 [Desulforudis sp. 1088]